MKFIKLLFSFRAVVFVLVTICSSGLFCQTLTPRYISMTSLSNGYYEYLPQGYDPSNVKRYPLLLCFGGYGENGDGSPAQLPAVISVWGTTGWQINQNIFPTSFIVNGQAQQFVILFPQFTGVANPQEINNIIDYALVHYRVDATRICLTGFSLGGGLVWDYCGYSDIYANRIAAIVPVCGGSYATQMKAQTIAAGNIAVWATHNDGDPTVPVQTTTIDYVNYINASSSPPNPLAKMTIFHDNSHNAWDSTYNLTYGLHVYEWMLQFMRGPGTLAVTSLEFNVARKQNDEVLLSWKTFSENNNRGFAIERSDNGINFDSIGFIKSSSNTGGGTSYSFSDMTPFNGNNYYRLKQENYDNTFKYSLVKFVETKNSNAFKIYPNPVKDMLNIKIGVPFRSGQLKIIDTKGRLISQLAVKGTGTIIVRVKHLSPGMYIVEITNAGTSSKFSFVKQ
ncbi:MAG: T9SS type A sorting domain-containing protein [Bacteroidota bacterium]|nr:T9SS type A sorting domain-containing protein [Bacteroidota bacterium]